MIPPVNTGTLPSESITPEINTPTFPTLVPTEIEITNTPTLTHVINTTPDVRYDIDLKWDYLLHKLEVNEKGTYLSASENPITELVLMADPNSWDSCLEIKSISLLDGISISNWELGENYLRIPLPISLEPQDEIGIEIQYELNIPAIPEPSSATRPIPFGYTQNQTNLVDWYLYFPPYRDDSGWVVLSPYYYGEHQVYETADFQIQLELINPPPNLTIAASSMPITDQTGIQVYQMENVRNFAFTASTQYTVLEDQFEDIKIFSYSFSPFSTSAAREVLNTTRAAVELYSNLFGQYPHSSLTVVEADFLDGMEYDGLYFLSKGFYNLYDGTNRGYLTLIAAHETAHQWWYAEIGNDQAVNPWLDESLATYCELLFYENIDPSAVDWWWIYRVKFYEPVGKINLAVEDYHGYTPYRNAVYLRGTLFFQELRNRMGDDNFFSFLQDLYSRNRDDILTPEKFWDCASYHGYNYDSSFYDEYFHSP